MSQRGIAVKMRHLKPQVILPQRGQPGAIVADPHGKPPRSALTSAAKIIVWLMEEWYAHLFRDKKQTLLLCDRYYHDLLVDSKRYRYGGPLWFARLVGALMPRPMLWVLLDAPVEVLQARKQEVPFEESKRQRQAYLDLVARQRMHIIVNAAQPLDCVIADVQKALADVSSPKALAESL